MDAYHEHCRKSAERFASTTDPVTAEHIAKACLILPASGADLAIVGRLADTSASASTKSGSDAARLEFPKGLMEYRQGHFASAVESMQKVLTHSGSVEAYMVLAMAKCQLKQIDEARSALAIGVEIAETKLPKLDSGGLGYDWADWVIAHALMREAKALIEHAPQPASEKSRTGVQSRELPRGSQSATPSTQPKSE